MVGENDAPQTVSGDKQPSAICESLMNAALRGALLEMPWPAWTVTSEGGADCALWTNAALDGLMRGGDMARAEADLKAYSLAVARNEATDATIVIGTVRFRPGLRIESDADGRFAAVGWLTPLAASDSRVPTELLETFSDRTLVFDQKTGLTVKASTDRELRAEISRSRRYGNALSVLLACVQVADGDPESRTLEALTLLSRTLKENLRWVDVLGAWDAQTVIVILPETSHTSAEALIEKLTSPLSVLSEVFPGVEFSMGVCQWADGMLPDDVVQGARQNAATLPNKP